MDLLHDPEKLPDIAQAVAAIADHIQRFWEPRMRNAIEAHLSAGGAGLDPFVAKAIASVARADAK